MKRALLIAEKPSAMRDIQKAYNKIKSSYPFEIDFACCVGHLIGLCEPDEYCDEWADIGNKDVLPMIPTEWKTKIINPQAYSEIKKLWDSTDYDYIINAGDAGREGQLINDLVTSSLMSSSGKVVPVLRFWADDLTEKTIIKTLNHLVPDENYKGLTYASYLRLYLDWLIGMNFSRATSISLARHSCVGRVMTVVLSMVSKREEEIRNFTPLDYYEIEGVFKYISGDTYKGYLINPNADKNNPSKYAFLHKEEVINIYKNINKNLKNCNCVIDSVTSEDKISYAPHLFSLTELQKKCSSLYKFSPAKTLAVAQKLYEKKLLSYPRTESKYITTEGAKEIPDLLRELGSISEFTSLVDNILADSEKYKKVLSSTKYVNNKKVSDHPALLPTSIIPNLNDLSDDERKIYLLVVKRLLAIFLPPHIDTQTIIITKVSFIDNNTENSPVYYFRSNGVVEKQEGWHSLYPSNNKSIVELLPNVEKGKPCSVNNSSIKDKKTTPPKRYTFETILTAMETAGKTLDDEQLEKVLMECAGLGTPATRGAILEKLFDYKYLEKSKTYILPTEEGEELVQALGNHSVTSPELTANWERMLKMVELGNCSYDKFYNAMTVFIKKETKDLLALEKIGPYIKTLGKCPKCKSRSIISASKFYPCIGYFEKDDKEQHLCSFALPKTFGSVTLSEADIIALISGKETKQHEFIWKNGNKRRTSLVLDDNLNISFPTKKAIGKCPLCHGNVYKAKGYFCENTTHKDENGNRQCEFFIYSSIGNTEISEDTMAEILEYGETKKEISVKWDSGKKYSGKITYDIINHRFAIKPFEEKEIAKCPYCTGVIIEEKFHYRCDHLRKGLDCSLQIPKSFLKATISSKDVINLLSGKTISKKVTFKNNEKAVKDLMLVNDPDKGYIIKW